jgi:hypothetical protein
MIDQAERNKMRACAPLLGEPAATEVIRLLDELEAPKTVWLWAFYGHRFDEPKVFATEELAIEDYKTLCDADELDEDWEWPYDSVYLGEHTVGE